MNTNRLSKTVIERLPLYLGYLKSEGAAAAEHISSTTIAKALRLNEDLVEAIALGHDLGHTPFGIGVSDIQDIPPV